MKTRLFVSALTALALVGVLRAQITLAYYNTDLAAPDIGAVSTVAANVTATPFALNNVNIGRVYLGTGVNHAATITPTVTQASVDLVTTLNNATYFSITVTPASGYKLDLASLSFAAASGGSASPRGFAVFSSIGGFTDAAAVLLSDHNGSGGTLTQRNNTPSGMKDYSISLTSGVYQNVTTPLTFRFYTHVPGSGQALDFDNITVSGNVSVIPEPAAATVIAGLFALCFATRRRRRD